MDKRNVDILNEIVECPQCGDDERQEFLGRLGRLLHFRCHCCGWTHSQ